MEGLCPLILGKIYQIGAVFKKRTLFNPCKFEGFFATKELRVPEFPKLGSSKKGVKYIESGEIPDLRTKRERERETVSV